MNSKASSALATKDPVWGLARRSFPAKLHWNTLESGYRSGFQHVASTQQKPHGSRVKAMVSQETQTEWHQDLCKPNLRAEKPIQNEHDRWLAGWLMLFGLQGMEKCIYY